MNVITATKSVLKNYAKFSGRASRSEFWYWALAQFLFLVVIAVLIQFIAPELQVWVNMLFALLFFVPNLSLQYRRLQDCNIHGAWCLIGYILIICFSLLRVVMLVQMQQGDFSLMLAYYEYLHSTPVVILQSVSVAYGIFLFVKSCTHGTDGDNKFGPEPED